MPRMGRGEDVPNSTTKRARGRPRRLAFSPGALPRGGASLRARPGRARRRAATRPRDARCRARAPGRPVQASAVRRSARYRIAESRRARRLVRYLCSPLARLALLAATALPARRGRASGRDAHTNGRTRRSNARCALRAARDGRFAAQRIRHRIAMENRDILLVIRASRANAARRGAARRERGRARPARRRADRMLSARPRPRARAAGVESRRRAAATRSARRRRYSIHVAASSCASLSAPPPAVAILLPPLAVR